MNRVVIIGCAGSGKSTLARDLTARTGLPIVERDSLGPLGSAPYRAAAATVTARPGWIFDGAPYYVEEVVYGAADLIIFLDYPKSVVMARVLRRTLAIELSRRGAGAHQAQGRAAWRDKGHPIRWAWKSHRDRHEEGLRLITRPDLADVEFLRFTRPAAAKRWLDGL